MTGTVKPLRVVLAEDHHLFRDLLAKYLAQTGIDVVAQATDEPHLLQAVRSTQPDVAVIDIKLPPGHDAEGLHAALEIRQRHPDVGVLLLSHYLETHFLTVLLADSVRKVGYLLKDTVSGADSLAGAIRRIAAGEYVVDPQVVALMIGRIRRQDMLADLTRAEHVVLDLMAQGLANQAIWTRLNITKKTVESHVSSILSKLGLRPEDGRDYHRRVQAVLLYLRSARHSNLPPANNSGQ